MSVNNFGRIPSPLDGRDFQYLVRAAIPQVRAAKTPTPRKYPYRTGPVLDQGRTPQCVGYSARSFIDAAPIMTKPALGPLPVELYHGAQDNDEWPGCVDYQTQCLTLRGWISGNELRIGDEILAFDRETETLRWTAVQAVHRYDDALYREFYNEQFSCAVTDSHRWVVSNRLTLGGPILRHTVDLKSQDEVWRSAPCGDLPTTPLIHDDIVEMVAWAVTEGHYRPEHRRGNEIAISQKSHRSRVAALMNRVGASKGYSKSDGTHVWTLSGAVSDAVREAAPSKAPTLEWLRRLTQRQLRLFIDASTLADGSVVDGEPFNRLSRSMFHQRPGPTLDSFLAATVLAGEATSRSSRREYTLSFTEEKRFMETWSLRESSRLAVRKLRSGEYIRGPVWCPQTAYGTFVARRDRSIFITGNSNYDGSSVRGACKYMYKVGLIKSYARATTIEEAVKWTNDGYGTLLFGSNWYARMTNVDRDGYMLEPATSLETPLGGHAYHIIWFDPKKKALLVKNSWGDDFGFIDPKTGRPSGLAYMRMPLAERLLREDGELFAPVQTKLIPVTV